MTTSEILHSLHRLQESYSTFNSSSQQSLKEIESGKYTHSEIESEQSKLFKIYQTNQNELQSKAQEIALLPEKEKTALMGEISDLFDLNLSTMVRFNRVLLHTFPCIHIKHITSPELNKALVGPRTSVPATSPLRSIADEMRLVAPNEEGFFISLAALLLEEMAKNPEAKKLFIDQIKEFSKEQVEKNMFPNLLLTASMEYTITQFCDDPTKREKILSNPHQIYPFVSYFRTVTIEKMAKDFDHSRILSYKREVERFPSCKGADYCQPLMKVCCEALLIPLVIHDALADGAVVETLPPNPPVGTLHRQENGHYAILYPKEPLSSSSSSSSSSGYNKS